jgi:hypothetical protein
MSRVSIQFVKKYNHIFLREERRPLLWEFKNALGKNKEERLREMNKELNISHQEWFENMILDKSERPAFLL